MSDLLVPVSTASGLEFVPVRCSPPTTDVRPLYASSSWPYAARVVAVHPTRGEIELAEPLARMVATVDAFRALLDLSSNVIVAAGVDADGGVVPLFELAHIVESATSTANAVIVLPEAVTRGQSNTSQLRALLSHGVEVLTSATVEDVLLSLFSLESPVTLPDTLRDDIVSAFFASAMFLSSDPLGWRVLTAVAIGLLRGYPADSLPDGDGGPAESSQISATDLLLWKLKFIRDVTRRHVGDSVVIQVPDTRVLLSLSPAERTRCLAHVLQSFADAASLRTPDIIQQAILAVEHALHELPSSEVSREGALQIAGAQGRALAAAGLLDRAQVTLGEAVAGWISLGQPGQASFALCELLRVKGLGQEREFLKSVTTQYGAIWEACRGSVSACFLELALGRALIQSGDLEGLDHLRSSSVTWDKAPLHVRAGRLRWIARGARLASDEVGMKAARSELESLGFTDQALLARLDEALTSGGPVAELVEAMLRLPDDGREVARTFERIDPWSPVQQRLAKRENLRRFAEEYRYLSLTRNRLADTPINRR